MAYSDFTLDTVASRLGIATQATDLFPALAGIPVPPWLAEFLSKSTLLTLISEKSRSEFIVAPVLLACREGSQGRIAIYSGQRLDVDPNLGLVGECDFILGLAPPVLPLRAPVATVVEAKKNDIEAGLGQCIAEMAAARLFNQAAGSPNLAVLGCVTTGEIWQFLELRDAVAVVDQRRYYLDDVGKILAVFATVIARDLTLLGYATS